MPLISPEHLWLSPPISLLAVSSLPQVSSVPTLLLARRSDLGFPSGLVAQARASSPHATNTGAFFLVASSAFRLILLVVLRTDWRYKPESNTFVAKRRHRISVQLKFC
jgi:hypothetical protein